MKYLNKQREEILAKQNTLEKAREQLKKEFIGIDDVIDEIISSVSSWYLFPEIQEKPVVVNLWGLTGTGKSSLVNRLAELLQQTNRYYRFDVAAKQPNREIRDVLEEIYINENGFPIMIAFDEFQNSRTLDRMGDEIDKPDTRIIWELIDSGKFQGVLDWSWHSDSVIRLFLGIGDCPFFTQFHSGSQTRRTASGCRSHYFPPVNKSKSPSNFPAHREYDCKHLIIEYFGIVFQAYSFRHLATRHLGDVFSCGNDYYNNNFWRNNSENTCYK